VLYILTALKCEAAPLSGLPGKIIVTGVGERARDCIAGIGLEPGDFVLNIGICAGGQKGKGYLADQVIDGETGRRFYPDILYDAGVPEMPLTTAPGIVTDVEDGMLYDMEASIICEKVLKIIPPSNLAIYKVVSDGGSDLPKPFQVTELIRSGLGEIKKIVKLFYREERKRNYSFLPEDAADELRLTQYMRNELRDIEHYCAVSGREEELTEIIDSMRKEGRIPVKDKKGGREVLDEIYSHLR